MFACSVQIVSGLDNQSKFQMFMLFSGRQICVGTFGESATGGTKTLIWLSSTSLLIGTLVKQLTAD